MSVESYPDDTRRIVVVNTDRIGQVRRPALQTVSLMPAERPNDRLRKARERAGFRSAAEFAKTYDLTESAYRHKENGTREISVLDAKNFSRLLSKKLGPTITWAYILNGELPAEETFANLVGYVGAGARIFPFDDDYAFEPIQAPPGLPSPQAAIVRGDSNEPVYRDGDILYFAGSTTAPATLIGHDCMVQITDGPRQVKQLRRGKARGFYRLYSYATDTESDDVHLDWVAPVRWVQKRR